MASNLPTVQINLWTEDAIVLFNWLQSADLRALLPNEHDAVLQALTDLLFQFEMQTAFEYELTPQRVTAAQHEVSKNMGW